jgi:trk system potassium uptake protein TrkA
MYMIIGGGGQIGYYLTKTLLAQGHETLLLEKDAKRYQALSEELGAAVYEGDACEAATMERVGCARADIVIAVTGDDEDNLVICQMAKRHFNVKRTIARVNNPRYETLFLRLGIDITVSPTSTILHLIEAELPHHSLVPLMTLRSAGLEIVELNVPPHSRIVGRALREIQLPRSCNIALIVRNHENIVPNGDTVIQGDDQIFALVTAEGEEALRTQILQTPR